MDAPTKIDEKASPETVKFQAWVSSEREKGLVDIKFFCVSTETATVEDVCKEANLIVEAKVVPDDEFF